MFRERIAMVGILRLGLPARKRTSMPRSGGQGTEMTRYREDKVQRVGEPPSRASLVSQAYFDTRTRIEKVA